MGVLDYFRMQNVFGNPSAQGEQQGVAPVQASQSPDESMFPSLPSRQPYQYTPPIFGDEPTPSMDRFRNVIEAMPERPRPSLMRQIGTGALSYVNAQQPDQVTESVDRQGRVSRSIKKGVWKPYGLEETNQILNMPYEQELHDWQNKARANQQAAQLESQSGSSRSLSAQRYANAQAIPRKVNIAQQNADRQSYLASLKDLPESVKLQLLQDGKIEIQDLRDANSMQRVNAQQIGATERTGMQQTGATERTGLQQTGATERTKMQQTGANQRNSDSIAAALERVNVQQSGAKERSDASVAGRAAKGAGETSATQQKRAALNKASEIINTHPEWESMIEVDPNTDMPKIVLPKDPWFGEPDYTEYDKIYEALYGRKRGGTAPAAMQQSPVVKPTAKPTAVPPRATSGKVRVVSPDGKTGTWDLSKGPVPKGFKAVQ